MGLGQGVGRNSASPADRYPWRHFRTCLPPPSFFLGYQLPFFYGQLWLFPTTAVVMLFQTSEKQGEVSKLCPWISALGPFETKDCYQRGIEKEEGVFPFPTPWASALLHQHSLPSSWIWNLVFPFTQLWFCKEEQKKKERFPKGSTLNHPLLV